MNNINNNYILARTADSEIFISYILVLPSFSTFLSVIPVPFLFFSSHSNHESAPALLYSINFVYQLATNPASSKIFVVNSIPKPGFVDY